MKALWFLVCVALLGDASYGAKPSSLVESTLVLNSTTFHQAVSSGKWLIDFYAPWCGHCKHLAPIFEEAAKHFKREGGKRVKLAKVDCDANGAVCASQDIGGYPTIKYYQNGHGKEYRAGRTKDGFIDYVAAMERPVVSAISSADIVAQTKKTNEVAFLFLEAQNKANLKEIYEAAASEFFDFDSPPCYIASDYEVEKAPAIAVIRDTDTIWYKGDFIASDISAWMKKNQYPFLVNITETNFDVLSKKPMLVGVYHPEQKLAVARKFISNMRELARDLARHGDGIQFALLDANKFDRFVANYEINAKDEPALFQLELDDEVHYVDHSVKYDSIESMRGFLNKVKTGAIKWQTWSYGAYYSAIVRKYGTRFGVYLYEYLYYVIASFTVLVSYLAFSIYRAIQADVQNSLQPTKRE